MLIVKRFNIKNRLIAITLAALLLAQDFVWAQPDICDRKASDTLATRSFLQDVKSPVKAEAIFIHSYISANLGKPPNEASLNDIKCAAETLIRKHPEWSIRNKIAVSHSGAEVLVMFLSGYAIRYLISADDRPEAAGRENMAVVATNIFAPAMSIHVQLLASDTARPTNTTKEKRGLDRAAKSAMLDRYINDAADMLQAVEERPGNEEHNKLVLTMLFNGIADAYINTADPELVKKRKKLLATLILANITPPVKEAPAEAVKGAKQKIKAVEQSALRSEICRKILVEKIFGSNDPDTFQPALEAVIELLARDKKRGRAFFFDRYYPILKESGKLPRFANAIIDVLIKAEHDRVRLFDIDDEQVFFDQTKLIIKDLSSSIPSLRRGVTSYLFNVLRSQGEIPLVRRLLEDINFHIVSGSEFGRFSAFRVAEKIRQLQRERKDRPVVLVLSGGMTMPEFLDNLAIEPDIDWLRVEIFQYAEWIRKSHKNPSSIANTIYKHLVKKVYKESDYGHFHPIGDRPDPKKYIEELNGLGGTKLLVLGLGSNGQIGYNSIGTVYDEKEAGALKLAELEANTIRENTQRNPDISRFPYAYTMSMADIMKADKIYLLATGPRKTHIVQTAFENPLMPKMPVSAILEHPNISVILDDVAVQGLTRDQLARYATTAEMLDRAEDRIRLLTGQELKPTHEINHEGTILWIVPEIAEKLGYRPEDMFGRPVWDFVAHDEREKFKAAVKAKLSKHKDLPPFEIKYTTSDGKKEIWFHIQEQQRLDKHGRVIGIISHMTDVTKEKLETDRLKLELEAIESRMNGNGHTVKESPPKDMTADDALRRSSNDGNVTNPQIIEHITDGKAIRIDSEEPGRERVLKISHASLNNRAPDIERHFIANGTFDKIRAARKRSVLSKIVNKPNFRNLMLGEKERLMDIAQELTVDLILGKAYVAVDKFDGKRFFKISHVRNGDHFFVHRLKPGLWLGEVMFNRFTVEQLAQFLLEESQHVLKPAVWIGNRWVPEHGTISEAANLRDVIEHDRDFIDACDNSEPTLVEALALAEPPDNAKLLGSIHGLALVSRPLPDNAQILLSENLFEPLDAWNLGNLLGDDSPVKIVPPEEMEGLYRARKNTACVIKASDYDDPRLWNAKASKGVPLLVLGEDEKSGPDDLQGSRYLFLEGVVCLARAMMNKDSVTIERYMKLLFKKTKNISDAELFRMLMQDPREFSKHVRFDVKPFDKEKLSERWKSDIENFLIKA